MTRLARAMEARGFAVTAVDTVADGIRAVEERAPAYAVVDMRLGDGNGLDVVQTLKARRPEARAIVLTGYGNIATAVTAVKMGAVDYLAKPADADEVFRRLMADPTARAAPPENPMSADRVRWEHIQRVYELCERNVSETARRLNMQPAHAAAHPRQARAALKPHASAPNAPARAQASISAALAPASSRHSRECAPSAG